MVQQKAYRGVGMEGRVARWYAARARKRLDEYRALARRMAERLPAGTAVLEVAPGPGYFAIELAKLGKFRITGLDISETFVAIARRNGAREAVEVDFRQGDASQMPFERGSFDLIICRAAFQNFQKPVKVLEEMRRVLKTGGTAVVIDLRKDVPREAINSYMRKVRLGLVDWLISQLIFRLVLVRRTYTKDQLTRFITDSGFRRFDIRDGPMFFEMWLENDGLEVDDK